jgi:hypothetical protein
VFIRAGICAGREHAIDNGFGVIRGQFFEGLFDKVRQGIARESPLL